MTTSPPTYSEHARQWIHIGSGLFALLLRWLTGWQAAALAATALFFNLLLLPRIGGTRLYRPVDHARGFPMGILLYPFSVLLLTISAHEFSCCHSDSCRTGCPISLTVIKNP